MFQTINYRHGWIHISNIPGCKEGFHAQAPYFRSLGNHGSLHAAKLAITRDAKQVKANRAIDAAAHHAAIQAIVRGE